MPMFKKYGHFFPGCLFVLLLASCKPPSSPPPAIDRSSPVCVLTTADNHRLQGFIKILADSETGYAIEDIAQPGLQNRFVAFADKGFELQSHQTYWGKIQLENRLPDTAMQSEWVLNFSSTFTTLTLFRPTENGT